MSAAVAAAAGGLTLAGLAPANAATSHFNTFVPVKVVSSTSPNCATELLSTQVTQQSPAYVAAVVVTNHVTRRTCTGWLETWTSRTGWRQAGGRITVQPFSGVGGFGLTALAADGPGHKARACLQAAGRVRCTGAITLKASSATPARQSLPASYVRHQAQPQAKTGVCAVALASTTRVKVRTSSVDGFFLAVGNVRCTGWIQVSGDHGKTWHTVSPTQPFKSGATTEQLAFSARYADGTGHLARACVQPAGAKRACTAGW